MLPIVKNVCAAAIQLLLYIYLFVSFPQMQKPQESSRGNLEKMIVVASSELTKSCRRFTVGLCGRHLRDSMSQIFRIINWDAKPHKQVGKKFPCFIRNLRYKIPPMTVNRFYDNLHFHCIKHSNKKKKNWKWAGQIFMKVSVGWGGYSVKIGEDQSEKTINKRSQLFADHFGK